MDEEDEAIALFDNFVRQNADNLRLIGHWGDGRCGALAERMANILYGPESEREPQPTVQARIISGGKRRAVFERDAYRCVQCGSYRSLEVDHIYPVSRGGTADIENLQTLCRDCNAAKGAKVKGATA